MGVRTSIEIALVVGLNFGLEDTVFDRTKVELLDTMNRAKGTALTLAPSTVNQQVPFDGIAVARMIYIEAKGEILVRLDSAANDPISLKRMVAPTSTQAPDVCAYALLTCEATALYLSNANTTDSVDVTVCIVGDIIT